MIEKMYFPSKHTKVKKCEIFMKFNLGVVSTQRMQKNHKFYLKKTTFFRYYKSTPPLPKIGWRLFFLSISTFLPNRIHANM